MSDFEPSPRSSKRRKIATYGSGRSTATTPISKSPSVLHSLSNAVSGISRRLFEPQTKRTATKSASETAIEATEQNLDGNHEFQNIPQVEEAQEDGKIHRAAAATEWSATHDDKTSGKEDDLPLVRKSKRANRSSKDSMREDWSPRRLPARHLGTNEEAMSPSAKDSPNNVRRSSNSKRHSVKLPEAGEETPKSRVTRNRSSGESLIALPKQSKARNTYRDPLPLHQVPAPENEMGGDEGMITTSQRSSGRAKRKPKKYSEDVEDMAELLRKQSAGILTPSTRNRAGARKSIAFEEEKQQIEDQLKFRDIKKRHQATEKAKRQRQGSSYPKEAEEPEPTSMSPEAQTVEDGDDPEEELTVEDAAFPDLSPVPQLPGNTMPVWDSLPGAHADPYLTAIKSKIISRLTNSSLVPLTNLATEYAKLHSLLKATITAGEGNSMLVLGARGSGKTALIETVLADVSHEHAEDFHVVRLNGFQQTDDKLALREIWRQLGREMQVEEEETNQMSSYADTMASLLHLLSHPEELVEVLEPDAPPTTTKSVIFVLDEFDLFATHPRQTLLYNLFDVAQAKKAPVAVIGCSTRVDVAESLEKRVKSRFSHRWVHLSQPKSLQAFEFIVKAALCLEAVEDEMVDKSDSSRREAWNEYMKSTFLPSPLIQALLRQTFYTTKSVAAIFSSLYIPVGSITSLDHPPSLPTSLATLTPPDSPLQLLPSLPPLHLYLLTSAARLDAIHNATVVNFNLVYQHYVELASRLRLQSSASGALAQGGVTKIWGREIAKGAWEGLSDWQILVPAALGKGKGDDAPETKMWRVDVTLEEVAACAGDVGPGVSEVLAKWCREV